MDKKAEMYANPGVRFEATGKLAEVLTQWDALTADQKASRFIKYDGKSYSGADVEKLKSL